MFNIFKSKAPQIRTDGFYHANWDVPGYAKGITIFLFFNKFPLVSYADNSEYKDEPVNIDPIGFRDGLCEFAQIKSFDPFEDVAKFYVYADTVEFAFYQPDDFEALENSKVNKDNFVKWQGKITNDGLILSRHDAFLNYNLQRYDSKVTVQNLKFTITPVNF